MQTYTYYKRFPDDRRVFKILVTAVMTLTFAHIICIMYWTWTLTVTGCENPDGVTIFSNSRDANLILTPLISTLVQMFFIYRLFKFSESKTIAAFCGILSMLNLTGTLVDAVKALSISTNRTSQNSQDWLTILTLVASAVCDLITTIGLVYVLQRERRRTENYQTYNIADRLTLWAIETGLATSYCLLLCHEEYFHMDCYLRCSG
jgi:heme/copper-type cytochrome/quinol oxidase subunit 2